MDILFEQTPAIQIASPGVEQIAVSISKGATGARGNKFFVNAGNPTQYTSSADGKFYLYGSEQIIENDMYWRSDSNRAYQFRLQPAGLTWVEVVGTSVVSMLTPQIDFSASLFQSIAITADTAFTMANVVAGTSVEVLVQNATGSSYTLSFPAWAWVSQKPDSIAAGQKFLLTLRAFGTAASDIVAEASSALYLYDVAP